MKPFTVINSPETDSMNMIHCCTIRSLFYTSALTSWQHHNLMMSHNLLHTERWTSSDPPELQNLSQRLLDASGAFMCTQTPQPQQVFLFSHFLTSKSKTEGMWLQYIKKALEEGACEEEFGPHTRVLWMHSRIPCLSLTQHCTPAPNRIVWNRKGYYQMRWLESFTCLISVIWLLQLYCIILIFCPFYDYILKHLHCFPTQCNCHCFQRLI